MLVMKYERTVAYWICFGALIACSKTVAGQTQNNSNCSPGYFSTNWTFCSMCGNSIQNSSNIPSECTINNSTTNEYSCTIEGYSKNHSVVNITADTIVNIVLNATLPCGNGELFEIEISLCWKTNGATTTVSTTKETETSIASQTTASTDKIINILKKIHNEKFNIQAVSEITSSFALANDTIKSGENFSYEVKTISQKPASGEVIYQSTKTSLAVTDIEIDGEYTNDTRFVFFEAELGETFLNQSDIDLPTDEETKNNPALTMVTRLSLSKIFDFSVFRAGVVVRVRRLAFTFDISNERSNDIAQRLNENSSSRKVTVSEQYNCVFSNNTSGKVSGSGLQASNYQRGKSVQCTSDHATVFAVLLSVTLVTIPEEVKIVSYVTEVTSIVFLVITAILLFRVRKKVRGDRVKIQINLTLSVLLLHVFNVLHDVAVLNTTTCEIVAVLIHYFLLTSALWMLMEGITLVFKTMNVVMRFLSGKNARKFSIFRYAVSWCLPALIVIVSAAVGFSNNSYIRISPAYDINNAETQLAPKYDFCWVSSENNLLLGSVIIPVALIMTLNILIVIRTAYVVYKMSTDSENYKPTNLRRPSTFSEDMDFEHLKAAFKAVAVLIPVLGLPWILGFFTSVENGYTQIAFMYANAILNGLQGLFIFVVYCIVGKEVRKAIMKSYLRSKYSLTSDTFNSKPSKSLVSETSEMGRNTTSTNVQNTYSDSPSGGKTDDHKSGKVTSSV